MLAAQPKRHRMSVEHPVVDLLRAAARRRRCRVHVRQGGLSVDLSLGDG
jgi:hypothetical protein